MMICLISYVRSVYYATLNYIQRILESTWNSTGNCMQLIINHKDDVSKATTCHKRLLGLRILGGHLQEVRLY